MKTAIMQPYFFPYLGYWQMFGAVEKFVLLDDVNFIMRGYINRNSILLGGQAHLFSLPLDKPSQNKLIEESKFNLTDKDKEHFLRTMQTAYGKAPYFKQIYPILEDIINYPNQGVTSFIKHSFEKVKSYLKLKTDILVSSEIKKDNSLKAQDRIVEINKKLGTTMYINAIGGQSLYNRDDFKKENMELKFIKIGNIAYKQFKNEFVPNLSMIDVLMFNSPDEIREMLNNYELI